MKKEKIKSDIEEDWCINFEKGFFKWNKAFSNLRNGIALLKFKLALIKKTCKLNRFILG